MKRLTFIDLFAGLSGFHTALSEIGMKCVFASEIDKELQDVYFKNYGLRPYGDIRTINEKNIPNHDVLCAGFPCQPFSLAGKKKGIKCHSSGQLIDDVIRIVKYHHPSYIFLENVPNIMTIDYGNFWNHITSSITNLGYTLDYQIYSPTDFNIPQNRKRVFIVACKKSLKQCIKFPKKEKLNTIAKDFFKNIDNKDQFKQLEKLKESVLNLWQDILNNIDDSLITSHSIVASEFGATYPTKDLDKLTLTQIKQYRGAWGKPLNLCKSWKDIYDLLPHYINKYNKTIPQWIYPSILHSRKIYNSNINFFDSKIYEFQQYPQSWHKIEWRGLRKKNAYIIWNHIIQFRPSGIRIIKPNVIPSLISMTTTQTPIIGELKRYITIGEAAALQGLNKLQYFPKNQREAFKALGNAVNTRVVSKIATHNLL